MDEQIFIQSINSRAKEFGMNPLLLLSGIEGLYTFRDVRLNSINFEFLDSLILTIFALRIGDQFHSLAEQNLANPNITSRNAAENELSEISNDDIDRSGNLYLKSFASIINGKSPIRKYHIKALEVAALEIKKAQLIFNTERISTVILAICKMDEDNSLGLASIFYT